MFYGIAAGATWAVETIILGIALSMAPFVSTEQAIFLAPFVSNTQLQLHHHRKQQL